MNGLIHRSCYDTYNAWLISLTSYSQPQSTLFSSVEFGTLAKSFFCRSDPHWSTLAAANQRLLGVYS